jgi:hypothetical protein
VCRSMGRPLQPLGGSQNLQTLLSNAAGDGDRARGRTLSRGLSPRPGGGPHITGVSVSDGGAGLPRLEAQRRVWEEQKWPRADDTRISSPPMVPCLACGNEVDPDSRMRINAYHRHRAEEPERRRRANETGQSAIAREGDAQSSPPLLSSRVTSLNPSSPKHPIAAATRPARTPLRLPTLTGFLWTHGGLDCSSGSDLGRSHRSPTGPGTSEGHIHRSQSEDASR